MAKLIHRNKILLPEMKYVTSLFELGRGLMFAGKNKVDRGICLVMPTRQNRKYGCAITMWFCFETMDIIFVNTEFQVVDKVTLKPWKTTYIPKKEAKYVIESMKNKFKNIKIGDKVQIKI